MAVYTRLDASEIDRIARRYALPAPVRAEPIAKGSENSNYRLIDGAGRHHILTIFEKRTRAEDVPFFLSLTAHLAEKGLPVPRPRVTGDDETTVLTEGGKTAAIVEFLPGEEAERITPAYSAAMGAMLARLHAATADFPLCRDNDLALEGWQAIFARIRGGLDSLQDGLEAELAQELEALATAWPRELPRAVVHLDLFPDNVFFSNEGLSGVIDFYFAAEDFLLYDLAITWNAWCFENGRFDPARGEAMRAAYTEARPLSLSETAAWPILLRGAALRFLLTRAQDALNPPPGVVAGTKDPLAYLTILRFHRGKA